MDVSSPEGTNFAVPPKRSSKWMVGLSIVLAAFFLYLALKGLDWKEFWRVISTGQYQYLGLVILVSSANYFLRSQRWRGILLGQKDKNLHPLDVFSANMVGYLGNSYLPARAGEVLRAVALGKKTGISIGFILATELIERMIDAIALILFGAFALSQIPQLPATFRSGTAIIAVIAFLGILFLLAVPSFERQLRAIISWIVPKESWNQKINELLSRVIQGFSVLRDPRRIVIFLLLTGLIWLIDGCSAVISAQIVRQSLNLSQALVFLAGLGLSSAIPSTPGYVGVYQFVAVNILAPFHFTQSTALAYILILEILNYLVVTLWGLLGIGWLRRASRPIHRQPDHRPAGGLR